MFGQEPRLPIDFLLGRIQEPVAGQVHRWIEEHQARLQVAIDGARERLQVVASRRKAGHDQRVKELPLSEGQLVYLRDYGVRGRLRSMICGVPLCIRWLKPLGLAALCTQWPRSVT